jgi:hypothetical protein
LPVVLYGCETWSLTLREECKLRVFENRVLRRISGPKRDEVAGDWKKNFIMRNLMLLLFTNYCAGDKIEMSEMGEVCRTDEGAERRV